MIKTVNIIDLFDDAAIERLRLEARRGQPVAVLLPWPSESSREQSELLLDSLHPGAPSYKPRAFGSICWLVGGSGRLVQIPEYLNSGLELPYEVPAQARPIGGFNANDFVPVK